MHTIGKDTINEICVMDVKTGQSCRITDDDKVHDAVWLGGGSNFILYLKLDEGMTQMLIFYGDSPFKEAHVVDTFSAPLKYLKVVPLEDESVSFAVVGKVARDGTLFNEQPAKTRSTVRVYDTYRTRYVTVFSSSVANFGGLQLM